MVTEQTVKEKPKWLKEEAIYNPPRTGESIKGKVVNKIHSEIWVDFGGPTLGVVPAREARDGLGTGKILNVGDEATAVVMSPDNQQGYCVLSLKQASKDLIWDILEKKRDSQEDFEIVPEKANKGGLMANVYGITGFLPVSQLSLENYPRVREDEKDLIVQKLKELTGKPLKVRVLDASRDDKKLIFSEKSIYDAEIERFLSKIKVGDIVEGVISGVVNFGAFVTIHNGLEGLIHISEIDWSHVDSPNQYFKEGQRIKAKVVSIDDSKVSLSTRLMKEDPWVTQARGIEVDSTVQGKVIKHLPFGALVSIRDSLTAICHISELSDMPIEKASQTVDINKIYDFKVIEFNPEDHSIFLSRKGIEGGAKAPQESSNSTEEPKEEDVDPELENKLLESGLTKNQVSAILKSSFKNINDLSKASDDDLMDIPGIGAKAIEKIRTVV
jgi:small subunit ribosomal protein S1